MTRTTIDDLLRQARAQLTRLEPEEALAAQGTAALLVDTRSADERARKGVIPGSIHVPLSVLPWRLDPDSDPSYRNPYVGGLDRQIVLVCANGYSTSLAAAMLQELGFTNATDLVGGFEAWRRAGLPVIAAPVVDGNALPGMGEPA